MALTNAGKGGCRFKSNRKRRRKQGDMGLLARLTGVGIQERWGFRLVHSEL